MARYQIKIELLSDLCVSDGGVYNSSVDTDCCHDEMGFPYIPAKRIKGCLRECALELNDWGKEINIDKIFGESGRPEKGSAEKRALLRIGNAYLQGFKSMREEVAAHLKNVLFHPQQVLNCFTSLRTQTSISQETGIADPHTLRTMRAANKGLVFTADVEMPSSFFEDVENCCKVFQQMGISRTRGFGDVEVSIVPVDDSASVATAESPASPPAPLIEGADFLDYEISLQESVICKSIAGGESRTLDYIEGSKVLGIILEALNKRYGGQDSVRHFLEDPNLRFTNAYIGCDGKRFTEVPAYIYSIKNNKEDYVDRRYHTDTPTGIQLSQMKHCYVLQNGDFLLAMDVNVEERYHHRRAEDKSIGRAISTDNGSDFYQMSSIMGGQKFYGRIYGSKEQIKTAYACITGDTMVFLGYGRSSEYGKSSIRITNTGVSNSTAESSGSATDIVVKLNAPAIIYNEKAICSVDREDLVTEILAALQIDRSSLLHYRIYANYTTIGGFNVTWGRRKPTIPAFDKGTVVCLSLSTPAAVPEHLFLGERCIEGYGETAVFVDTGFNGSKADSDAPAYGEDMDHNISLIRSGSIIACDPTSQNLPSLQADDAKQLTSPIPKDVLISPGSLSEKLADRIFITWLGTVAREKVSSVFKTTPEKYRPTISNLLTGFDDYQDFSQVEQMILSRYGKKSSKKEEKLQYAQEILEKAQAEFAEARQQFYMEHGILQWDWTQENNSRYQLAYLRELLISMKLKIRGKQNTKQEDENG